MSKQIPLLDIVYQWSQTFLQTYNIDDNITKEPLDHVVPMHVQLNQACDCGFKWEYIPENI